MAYYVILLNLGLLSIPPKIIIDKSQLIYEFSPCINLIKTRPKSYTMLLNTLIAIIPFGFLIILTNPYGKRIQSINTFRKPINYVVRANHNITYIQECKPCQKYIHCIHTIKHGIIDLYENASGSDTTVGLWAENPNQIGT